MYDNSSAKPGPGQLTAGQVLNTHSTGNSPKSPSRHTRSKTGGNNLQNLKINLHAMGFQGDDPNMSHAQVNQTERGALDANQANLEEGKSAKRSNISQVRC